MERNARGLEAIQEIKDVSSETNLPKQTIDRVKPIQFETSEDELRLADTRRRLEAVKTITTERIEKEQLSESTSDPAAERDRKRALEKKKTKLQKIALGLSALGIAIGGLWTRGQATEKHSMGPDLDVPSKEAILNEPGEISAEQEQKEAVEAMLERDAQTEAQNDLIK